MDIKCFCKRYHITTDITLFLFFFLDYIFNDDFINMM